MLKDLKNPFASTLPSCAKNRTRSQCVPDDLKNSFNFVSAVTRAVTALLHL